MFCKAGGVMYESQPARGLFTKIMLTLCIAGLITCTVSSVTGEYACDEKIFDDGTISNAFYLDDSLAVMARKFEGSFSPVGMEWGEVNTISLGEPFYPWPDPTYDPVEITMWEGDSATGLPSYPPIWTTVVTPSDSPPAVRVYPPDTVLSSSNIVFLGMRNPDRPDCAEGLAVDAQRDTGGTYLSMDGGQSWSVYSVYGDWHIRACLIYPHAVEEAVEGYSPSGTLLKVVQNPFQGTAVIQYSLFWTGDVNLSIYDAAGALVDVLVDGYQGAGTRQVRWSAQEQPGGVYFCRLRADGISRVVKVIRLQ
jgi:hypothetical protein